MSLTKKDKIKELSTFEKHNVLMTDIEHKELKLGHFEDIEEKHNMSIDEMDSYITKHKQIEKELGIGFITLFRALEQGGIWVKEQNTKDQEIVYERVRLNFLNKTLDFVEPRKEIGKGRNLFGYGKTWALTREELE